MMAQACLRARGRSMLADMGRLSRWQFSADHHLNRTAEHGDARRRN
jgi:hypothetical protein